LHQPAIQVDIQVGGRPEALDQAERAGVGLLRRQPGLSKRVARDDSLNDRQHRRHQLRL
jgi:hypothetical protein